MQNRKWIWNDSNTWRVQSLHAFIWSMQTGDDEYTESICRPRYHTYKRSVRSETYTWRRIRDVWKTAHVSSADEYRLVWVQYTRLHTVHCRAVFIVPEKLYFTTRLGFKLRETIGIEQVEMDTVLITPATCKIQNSTIYEFLLDQVCNWLLPCFLRAIIFSASKYNYYQLRNVIEKLSSGVHVSCRRVPEPKCWHSQFRLEMSCDRD